MAAPDGTVAVRAVPDGDAVAARDDGGEQFALVLDGPSVPDQVVPTAVGTGIGQGDVDLLVRTGRRAAVILPAVVGRGLEPGRLRSASGLRLFRENGARILR